MWTIGHSTRSLDELIGLLRENGIALLADIRRYPGSRRYPHFSRESLAQSLPGAGIEYVHLPDLGGRRTPEKNSPNTAWRNAQFRGYADYMATSAFRNALDELLSEDRKSTRLNSSHLVISYAVFCLKKKKKRNEQIWCIDTNNIIRVVY